MEKKKYGYAIIGSGGFSLQHATALSLIDEAKMIITCDKHIEKAKELAEKFNIPNYCTDYSEAINRDDVDVVVVTTSDQEHCEITIAALKAGKHVMCEKPMSLFVDECKKMVKADDESDKLLMIGQVCRCTPAFKKAKELVDSGEIGELFYVESEYAHDYAKIPGTDGWRTDENRNPVIGGACHAIDLLRWIAGNPTDVSAFSNHKVLTSWPVNDCTVAIFKFPNDVIGKVFTSIGCKRDYTMRTCLYGTKGTIICNNKDTHMTLYREEPDENKSYKEFNQTVPHLLNVYVNNHNVVEEHRSLLDSVKNGTPLVTTAREGASTVAVCCAAVESAKTGKMVTIDYNF